MLTDRARLRNLGLIWRAILADACLLRRGVVVAQRIKTGSRSQVVDGPHTVVLRKDVVLATVWRSLCRYAAFASAR